MSNKIRFGEVFTDISLVQDILDLIPQEKYLDPTLRWLDPAAGSGNFMKTLSKKLMLSLAHAIPDPSERKHHIESKMLFMVEINGEHIPSLRKTFPHATIIHKDFLTYKPSYYYDIIIGNPPFNNGGLKKVPTNTNKNKKDDGKTVWTSFIRHALSMLSYGGFLSMISPSIWMKPDKAGIYNLFTKCTSLKKVRCFTNTESNRLFHGQAQTPICYFLLKKEAPSSSVVSLYERNTDRYIPYPLLSPTHPLPVFGASLFIKLQPYVLAMGSPTVIKTSMPPKNTVLSTTCTTTTPYRNVRSCILTNNVPQLTYEYSQSPLAFHGTAKLILAHKMYGFPYYDASGTLGISRRDNYILQGLSREDFRKWHSFLSTKLALYLMEGTRYRMKYLEKYVFEMIPNITRLDDFPRIINDDTLAEYFQLTSLERNAIAEWSKDYQFFLFDV